MIILVDDERSFKEEVATGDVTVLKSSKEAIKWLEGLDKDDVIEQLWFDHDLGIVNGEKDTTIPFLRKLEELCFFNENPTIRQVVVHTSNNVGGDQIMKSMSRYFPTVRVFAGDYLEAL